MAASIRTAVRDDVEELVRLASTAAEGIRDSRGGPELLSGWDAESRFKRSLELLPVGPEGTERRSGPRRRKSHSESCWVAEGNGLLVGFMSARLSGSAVVVDSYFVAPEWRRRRLATRMLRLARDWGSANDRYCVEAFALPGDRGSKALFESAQMKARLLIMFGGAGPAEESGT